MRGETLFRAGQKAEGDKPLVQGNVATMEDRADAHREFLAAGRTPVPAAALSLGRRGGGLYRVKGSAVRAVRTIRPPDRLQLRPRGLIIAVARVGQFGGKL